MGRHENVLRLRVDEAEVEGEEAVAVAVGKLLVDDEGVGGIGDAVDPDVGGGMAVVVAKPDGVGIRHDTVQFYEEGLGDGGRGLTRNVFGGDGERDLIQAVVVVAVEGGDVVAVRRAVAEIPFKLEVLVVDFRPEGDGAKGAAVYGVVLLDGLAVDEDCGRQVGGGGAHQIGIAFGVAKAVDVGVEPIVAGDAVHAVADVQPRVAVVVVAVDAMEVGGRDDFAVEKHVGAVFGVDDDVDAMRLDVDVGMVKGGEGHVVDALLHGGYPHHGGVALGLVVACLVEVNGAGLGGLEVARALALENGEVVELAGIKRVNGYAVQGDGVAVGA